MSGTAPAATKPSEVGTTAGPAEAPLRAQFPVLEHSQVAYLDCAATALVPRAVIDAQLTYDLTVRANVSRGIHNWAEQATSAFEDARAAVSGMLQAQPEQIALVGGTTAALNMLAWALGATLRPGDRILASVAEHHSNLVPWQMAASRSGAELAALGLDASGAPDVAALPQLAGKRTKVIALTHASNVTGAPTDIGAAARHAADCGAVLVVDGAQMMPHGPLAEPPPCDYYAFSGHKCFAPTGIGVLYSKDGFAGLDPPAAGGGSVADVTFAASGRQPGPRGWEPGTPPISQAVGLAAAARWMASIDRQAEEGRMAALAGRLAQGLASLAGVRMLGAPAGLPGHLPLVSFVVDGVHPHDVCEVLNAAGVAVRGGHQCAQPLMAALGAPEVGCVRASLGPHNDSEDISRLLAGLAEACDQLR